MNKFGGVSGLGPEQVSNSRKLHGSNTIPPPLIETFWEKLRESFNDPLIRILCVALLITLALAAFGYADWLEATGIAASVCIATVVATYSEFKNEASFQELQAKANRTQSMVFRENVLASVDVCSIVVGDCVLLQAGDRVPADGVLVEGWVSVNQSSLNGETEPACKTAVRQPGPLSADTCLVRATTNAFRHCEDLFHSHRCFRGAVIEEGEGVLLVDLVGEATVHGKLATELNACDDGRLAPLKEKLSKLADDIAKLGYMGASLIALSFMFKQVLMDNHYSWTRIMEYLANYPVAIHDCMTSVILGIIVVVVAVPEGLPMMIAITLSLNMRKLLRQNVLVRRLIGIETAGCLQILFADKTGTITYGKFLPEAFIAGNRDEWASLADMPVALGRLLAFVARNSTSAVVNTPVRQQEQGSTSIDMNGNHQGLTVVGGNSTDRALLHFLEEAALVRDESITVAAEVLFSSDRKFSATQILAPAATLSYLLPSDKRRSSTDMTGGALSTLTLIKGAAELVLNNCTHYYDANAAELPLSNTAKRQLLDVIDTFSCTGRRLIALAACTSPVAQNKDETGVMRLPTDLVLLGVLSMSDRLRPSSIDSIAAAHRAGITVVMVTGDRMETATAVAREIGLLQGPGKEPKGSVMTSADLMGLAAPQLAALLPTLKVVGRALPSDKSRLVEAAQHAGMVVGMTGDGVNDSAGLRRADVSFAMGSGAEVAKEAADIVILDDEFGSILQAVLFGRTLYKSIRKFIVFQSTINLASTLIVFVGPFLGFDFPLTLIQLLWLNLVMDTLAGLAFGGEPALQRYLLEQPGERKEHIISRSMWHSISFGGLSIALSSIAFLTSQTIKEWFSRPEFIPHSLIVPAHEVDPAEAAVHETSQEVQMQGGPVFLTAFFCFFIFICTFNAFNVRTTKMHLGNNILLNPGFVGIILLIFVVQILFTELGGKLLRTVPLTYGELILVLLLSALIVPADLLRKSMQAPARTRASRLPTSKVSYSV